MDKAQFNDSSGGIAIIGMSGRLPRAGNLDEFWRHLQNGVDCISDFSDEELMDCGIDPALIRDPAYVKRKGIIDDADLFDAHFFGINPGEAEVIDPQQRLFLETAYEVLEKAGYTSDGHAGPIGVYAGCSLNTYLISNLLTNPEAIQRLGAYQIMVANDKDFLATRTSYKLNLSGPSLTIQTACSTSLVTVHMACQGLLNYECDMALAGGISVAFPQRAGYLFQEGMILSPDGHCRTFDADAQGIVAGEGVGVVLLKRLDDALTDGDNILAVIKGSAINNDGSLKAGYTAPSVDGQAEVIAAAHAMAGIDASSISYVEAHGTGTSLGDPIEIAALTKAFRHGTDENGFCAIGSVKTNIGHLDTAAGVASLIKTVLALQHKQLPPSLHFQTPNPHIDFEASPFYVNTRLADWNTDGHPRRAGVSSFGIGGTNAHMVVEEAPVREPSGASRPCQLLLLSAKTANALDTATAALADHLSMGADADFADVAYTLKVGRRQYGNRRMAVCRSRQEAVSILGGLDPQKVRTHVDETLNRPVVFMFSGQGAQYVNMGLDLYRREPAYRDAIDACSGILKPHIECDLREILYPDAAGVETASRRLGQTEMTQPALFAVEYALVKLWEQWGIQPQAMIGHSIGEYVAACRAGVFTLEEALVLVARRGRLIQSLPKGAMLAVGMSENEIMPHLDKNVSLAAVNSTAMCVVSGETGAVAELEKSLEANGTGCIRLQTSHAFHSKMMDPILDEFTQFVSKIDLKPPVAGFISNVTGTWITPQEATDPQYWARHLRHTVRFADGITELLKDPASLFLEVGPGQTLVTLVERHKNTSNERVLLPSTRHPKKDTPDDEFILDSLGRLWMEGVDIDWKGYYRKERRYRVALPTHPFERARFWIEPKTFAADESRLSFLVKQKDISNWFYVPSWKRSDIVSIHEQKIPIQENTCWLIFQDALGIGQELSERLISSGQKVVNVTMDERYSQASPMAYTIDPRSRKEYEALLNHLIDLGETPKHIIHLWGFNADDISLKDIDPLSDENQLGFYSVLYLAQALNAIYDGEGCDVTIVSNNAQDVTGQELLQAAAATMSGLCKTIPQENPEIICRNIDFSINPADQLPNEFLIESLLQEISGRHRVSMVAYRGCHRWVQIFEKIKTDDRSDEVPAILRKNGVYLITGGLGNIGHVLAKYLAKYLNAQLIMVGRTILPHRREWENWITAHPESDSVSRKILRIRELEKEGAEVHFYSVDVANLTDMQTVIDDCYAKFGVINGVIHAAGIIDEDTFRTIPDTKKADCQRQYRAKMAGLLVLDKILYGKKLDFFVLTSSLSSVLGGFGYSSYAAANIFMDIYTLRQRRTRSLPWISVNWDAWIFEEPTNEGAEIDIDLNKLAIKANEGAEVFRRVLSIPTVPQLVVSTGNLKDRIDRYLIQKSDKEHRSSEEQDSSSHRHQRMGMSTEYFAPETDNQTKIAQVWQEMLGIENVGIYDNFFELGGHSLLATQIISRFFKLWNIQVPLRKFFDSPTIKDLANVVDDLMRDAESEYQDGKTEDENREIFEI